MKDYGLRRPSFSNNLASLGGLTALAEESGQEDTEEEEEGEEEELGEEKDLAFIQTQENCRLHNKCLGVSNILPPIHKSTPDPKADVPQVDDVPFTVTVIASAKADNTKKNARPKTRVGQPMQKISTGATASSISSVSKRPRQRKLSLVGVPGASADSKTGTRGNVLLRRRHSTATDQPETRYTRKDRTLLHTNSVLGTNHNYPHRLRAQTWHSGKKSNTADILRKSKAVSSQKEETKQGSDEAGTLKESCGENQNNAKHVDAQTPPIEQGPGNHMEETEEDLNLPDRPSNRRGRRWSRPDFAETSRKVSLLLHAARGATRKGERKLSLPTWHFLDDDFPKFPRFSSFMSAEAQYALMQGYEDRLVEWLERKFPGYIGLRRSSTPGKGVNIRKQTMKPTKDVSEDEASETDCDDMSKSGFSDDDEETDFSDFLEKSPRQTHLGEKQSTGTEITKNGFYVTEKFDDVPLSHLSKFQSPFVQNHNMCKQPSQPLYSTSLPTFSNSLPPQIVPRRYSYAGSIVSEPPDASDSRTALKSLRRLSNPLSRREFDVHKLFGDEDEHQEGLISARYSQNGRAYPLRRHGSVPTVSYDLSSERRLTMASRLENAMDILDTLRAEQGEGALLSPRSKVRQGRVAPLSDYNTWVSQWNREFKVTREKI
ncbi:hypothetical protein PoB_001462200 [Plakobranchus ocellatus]|uniref:Uncharacterized protein n=1 Tax=Plakobranchus ocellatus TaxID=259542 RepID=A0AAV3Z0V2_9GAST|nr:hypothetical protein PoB_001462200 [Plakobranchus ocellatus]